MYSQHVEKNAEELAKVDGEFSFHIRNMDLYKYKLRVCGAAISAETWAIKAT